MSSIKRFTRDRFGRYAILRNLLPWNWVTCSRRSNSRHAQAFTLSQISTQGFNSPYMDISKITEKGNALAIVTVCSALSPPARRSAIATTPMSDAQKIRCQTGVFATPPDARVSTTIAPESADVTKKTMTIAIAINDSTEENGKCSVKLNKASETSCWTVLARSVAPVHNEIDCAVTKHRHPHERKAGRNKQHAGDKFANGSAA